MYELMLSGVLQGLLLTLVAYGVMIPFRFLNFTDVTAEGSYPLGGAICACLIIYGIHPFFAILIAVVCTGIIGLCTALVHLHLKVNTLLAGIIISTMIYSLNLRMMEKPNLSLFDQYVFFNVDDAHVRIMIMLSIIMFIVVPFMFFLHTEFGLRFRAVGSNPQFAARHGISITKYNLLGLFIGNAFIGLSGSLMVQMQRYMDVGMGIGVVIHGLAAIMIGENIVGVSSIKRQLLAPLVGAIVYQQIYGIALLLGLAPSDLKFFTGAVLLFVISLKA